ncbi:hypothetical protein [Deinococcus aquaticus]|uniref:Uncharacterized protein n=1 Tax=Deinococcus aquaticus TaxID=328692 RepID=A0ABY7V214_9DEIO|nr:hypothetical protein [Deinococcus aquaticus]WDA58163.1 hypothetical protein M8445_12510 [Deinococcus aquaticus]
MAKTGIPGKQKLIYTRDAMIGGSIAPMSLADYSKRYSDGAYINNGAYSFSTIEILKIGDVLEYSDMKLKVIGFVRGRFRNHAHLLVIANE